MFLLIVSAAWLVGVNPAAIPSPSELVKQIYNQCPPPSLVVYLTGGGVQLVPWMLAIPGASRSVLDLQVPYSEHALAQLLGGMPDRFCDPKVARQMAQAAFHRAKTLQQKAFLSEEKPPCIGLGCTAALVSERPRRGVHGCHIAIYMEHGVHEISLELEKDVRSREMEDSVVARCVLVGLAASCGISVEDERQFCHLSPVSSEDPQLGDSGSRGETRVTTQSSLRDVAKTTEKLQWSFSEHTR